VRRLVSSIIGDGVMRPRQQTAQMGVLGCTALVIDNMIGSGVFLLPSTLANYGTLALAGCGLSTASSLVLALMFARFSGVMPAAGGPYAYTRQAFGEFAGFLAAWCYWKAAGIGNAAISISLIGYMSVYFPYLAQRGIGSIGAIAAVWTCARINMFGIRVFSTLSVLLTTLKLIPLMTIAISGWWYFHPAYLSFPELGTAIPELNIGSAIATAATLTMWSFIGLESATVPAEAVRNPQRSIPIATLLGTTITAIVYPLQAPRK